MTFQLDRLRALPGRGAAPRRRGQGLRGRGRDPLPHARGGTTGWDDLDPRADRVPERRPRRPVYRARRRPADLQLRLAGRGLARRDHPRDPRRRPRLEHPEADPDPRGARRRPAGLRAWANINGEDGRKLSKRHGAVSVDEFREGRVTSPTRSSTSSRCSGGAPDVGDDAHVPARRSSSGSPSSASAPSPATFDYRQPTGYNGVYLRALASGRLRGGALSRGWASRGSTGTRSGCARRRRSCRRRSRGSASSPAFAGFLFGPVEPIRPELAGAQAILSEAATALEATEPFTAGQIETALKELCERLELKPRQAFAPIRVAVTGSKVSPGLYESLELLGKAESLQPRPGRGRRSGLGGASGSSACWKSRHARRRNCVVGVGRTTSSSLLRGVGAVGLCLFPLHGP